MSKKKKKRQVSKATAKSRARKSPSRLARFLKRHRKSILKYSLWGGTGIAVIVVVVLVFTLIQSHSKTTTKESFLLQARQHFMLGQLGEAIIDYHQAENAAPGDKQLAREVAMVKVRASLSGTKAVQNAIAASMPLLDNDPYNPVLNANLAQLYDLAGDIEKVYKHANVLLKVTEQNENCPAKLTACASLELYFRQKTNSIQHIIMALQH